jgi:hypothetical protein
MHGPLRRLGTYGSVKESKLLLNKDLGKMLQLESHGLMLAKNIQLMRLSTGQTLCSRS